MIAKYRIIIESQFSKDSEEFLQLDVFLKGSELATSILEQEYLNSEESNLNRGFWTCMANNGGKTIARGLAWGALSGAVIGGIVGGPAGAVAGAVYGAARGAVVGAAGGAFWSAADCLRSSSDIEIYKDSFSTKSFIEQHSIDFSAKLFSLPDTVQIDFVTH